MEPDIEKEGGAEIVRINPKLFSLDVVYTAAYVFLDQAYIVLDGDPDKEIVVKIKPKVSQKDLGLKFHNELITYAEYKNNFKDSKEVRDLLLQASLLTSDPGLADDLDYVEDPEGIRVPWEEKYGKAQQ